MKKFIIIIIFTLIPVISFSTVSAQTDIEACKNKYNGQECSYKAQADFDSNIPGKCDRRGNGTLYCNPRLNGWKDCFTKSQPNDACEDSSGQSGTCQRQGSGDNFTCDTSTGGGTCQDCGGNKCDPGQVCADQGPAGQKKPTCVTDKGNNNTCRGNACSAGQVCIEDGPPTARTATCVSNKCTGGGGAGNGGGGTPPPGTVTPPASSPQTVSFINPSRFNSIIELVAGVINALLGILGAITVAILVKSGFEYMISSDSGAVGKALDGIKNAIVGLMIIMGAFLITQYVITALAG